MKTLFLAWQSPQTRAWFPIGRLEADEKLKKYIFHYTQGIDKAKLQGFHPMSAFPEFSRRYESSELFPLFKNRVLASNRRGFQDYLRSLDLDSASVDLLDILAITGGERQTDSLEVFPKLEKNKESMFKCRFFLHGLSYCHESVRERILALQVGESLGILLEVNNPATSLAIQFKTTDQVLLGWSPRYLVNDLLGAAVSYRNLQATVVLNNPEGTPLNRRVLVEMTGILPDDYEPMSSNDFQILH